MSKISDLGTRIGSFIAGSFTRLLLRQKSNEEFEIGQLIVAGENLNNYSIYQINDLKFGSQIPESSLELMAGYQLEKENANLKIYEPELRNYVLAFARPLIHVQNKSPVLPKKLPKFFSELYELNDDHLKFLEETRLENPITLGKVRSGSKVLNTTVSLEAKDVLTHHILIPATTGRGKSNLVKVILYNLMENENCGKLVLDPHNEYYESLRFHPEQTNELRYYSIREHPHGIDLRFNTAVLNPGHLMGALDLTPAQQDAIIVYYRDNRAGWIENIFTGEIPANVAPLTVNTLRRKVGILLNLELGEDDEGNAVIREHGIYRLSGYETTVDDIIGNLERGRTVVMDTSLLSGNEEILVATIVVDNVLKRYQRYKYNGTLDDYPVITIVLEEAPRVIGKNALEKRENIFGTIAREGRKFNIGLIAITQLPSVIPREILANMNTKIILGNEMGPERRAIIESAAQDLSDNDQNIASLDKGEAIVTSNFAKFAIPIKIPLFSELLTEQNKEKKEEKVSKRSPF